MNTSILVKSSSALLLAGLLSSPVHGLLYDFKSTEPSQTSFASKLYESGFDRPDQAPMADTLLPAGTKLDIWIVADTGNNGLPFLPTGIPGGNFELGGLQFLGADDYVIATDKSPGNAFGATSQPGRYGRNGVAVNDLASNATIYFILFGVSGVTYELGGQQLTPTGSTDSATPVTVSASSLGVFSFGNPSEPPVGNAFLSINSPVFADQFSAVPEPEQYAAMAGVGLLAFAGWYRARQRKA